MAKKKIQVRKQKKQLVTPIKAFGFLLLIIVGLLMWAALDDITTGSEISYWQEWAMVGGGMVVFAATWWKIMRE